MIEYIYVIHNSITEGKGGNGSEEHTETAL